jgi:hypothetical protein
MDLDDTDWYPRYYGRPEESSSKTIELHNPDFSVEVFHHEIYAWRKQHPCWTYVSNGLGEHQQSEMVFSLLRRADETVEQYPEAPIEWMRVVCELARQGVHLEIGQPVEVVDKGQPRVIISGRSVPVDEQKWKSMTAFRMFVHGNPLRQRIFLDAPKSFPVARHNVVAFISEEAELIKTFGVTRVVSHLGLSHKWFPYPPWIDRDRKECCTLSDFENSIRSRLETVQIRGLAAISVKHHVILAIPNNTTSRETFRSSILDSAPEKPVALTRTFHQERLQEQFGKLAMPSLPYTLVQNWEIRKSLIASPISVSLWSSLLVQLIEIQATGQSDRVVFHCSGSRRWRVSFTTD